MDAEQRATQKAVAESDKRNPSIANKPKAYYVATFNHKGGIKNAYQYKT